MLLKQTLALELHYRIFFNDTKKLIAVSSIHICEKPDSTRLRAMPLAMLVALFGSSCCNAGAQALLDIFNRLFLNSLTLCLLPYCSNPFAIAAPCLITEDY